MNRLIVTAALALAAAPAAAQQAPVQPTKDIVTAPVRIQSPGYVNLILDRRTGCRFMLADGDRKGGRVLVQISAPENNPTCLTRVRPVAPAMPAAATTR